MGRVLRFLSSGLILAAVMAVTAFAQARTTLTYVTDSDCDTEACTSMNAPGCREGRVLYVCNTTSGFYEPVASVDAGTRFNLEGASGDSYFKFDSDTSCIQQWTNGVMGWQLCTSHVIPPTCPTDKASLPFGSICKDAETGKVMLRGQWEVIQ